MIARTSGTTIQAAASHGIPAVLVEIGGKGQWTPEEVKAQLTGLWRAAATTGVLDEAAEESTSDLPIYEVAAGVEADAEGLWFPFVQPGEEVRVDDVIGVLKDPFGDIVREIRSPAEGTLLYGLNSLAAIRGDLLGAIARRRVTS
jgi:predicted deacylase